MRSKFVLTVEHVEQSRCCYSNVKNCTSDQITFCCFKSTASDSAMHLGIFSPYFVNILRVLKNQEFLRPILGLCEPSPLNAPRRLKAGA